MRWTSYIILQESFVNEASLAIEPVECVVGNLWCREDMVEVGQSSDAYLVACGTAVPTIERRLNFFIDECPYRRHAWITGMHGAEDKKGADE